MAERALFATKAGKFVRAGVRAAMGRPFALRSGTPRLTAGLKGSALNVSALSKEAIMDKEHVKGAADKAKGAVKDAAGKMMDDKKLQAEGKMDKAKGSAREALGDAKDAVKRGQGK